MDAWSGYLGEWAGHANPSLYRSVMLILLCTVPICNIIYYYYLWYWWQGNVPLLKGNRRTDTGDPATPILPTRLSPGPAK